MKMKQLPAHKMALIVEEKDFESLKNPRWCCPWKGTRPEYIYFPQDRQYELFSTDLFAAMRGCMLVGGVYKALIGFYKKEEDLPFTDLEEWEDEFYTNKELRKKFKTNLEYSIRDTERIFRDDYFKKYGDIWDEV